MGSPIHSLNYELPQELHFDKYAQHILQNSRTPNLADTTNITPISSHSIPSFDDSLPGNDHHLTTSEFFKKLGATFINSIQLQSLPRTDISDNSVPTISTSSSASIINDMDMEFGPHHLLMDSQNYNSAMDELQKQLDYDKFMNEVWIGVVLTLIMISMIFCFCSCFLYHQFRVWKRNYRTTVIQTCDVESVKLNTDLEDPVPEYTLVSGLPSYEAALELLHKNPQSCLLLPPSVFEVFNEIEKSKKPASESSSKPETSATIEVCTPLLTDSSVHNDNKSCLPSYNEINSPATPITPALTHNHSLASLLSLATTKSSQTKSKSAAPEADKQSKS